MRLLIAKKWGHAVKPQDFEDLLQAGAMGLMDAARRFDPARGFKFSTFASRRIIGAAIDWLRQVHGRRDHQRIHHLLECDTALSGSDDAPTVLETAPGNDGGDQQHSIAVVRAALRDRVAAQFDCRIGEMAARYWIDRITMRAIGEAFGVTEARVSQILRPLRERVPAWVREEVAAVAG